MRSVRDGGGEARSGSGQLVVRVPGEGLGEEWRRRRDLVRGTKSNDASPEPCEGPPVLLNKNQREAPHWTPACAGDAVERACSQTPATSTASSSGLTRGSFFRATSPPPDRKQDPRVEPEDDSVNARDWGMKRSPIRRAAKNLRPQIQCPSHKPWRIAPPGFSGLPDRGYTAPALT